MSGEAVTIRSQFVPPPLSGLDLISSPADYDINNARQLDNYFIYDNGLRERGAFTSVALPDASYPYSMFPFDSTSYSGSLISSATNIYRYSGTSFTLLGNPTAPCIVPFAFKRNVFFPIGTTNIPGYNLDTDTYTASTLTLPATHNPTGGFVYRNRVYIPMINTSTFNASTVAYFDVGQVSGAYENTFDFGEVFQRGRAIVLGFSWSFNDGIANKELFVVGNNVGELLIYEGSYPGSDSWQLATRVDIPAPLTFAGVFSGGVLKVGQDVYILTARGIISLAQVIAGNSKDINYYLISRQLGENFSIVRPSISREYPFAYFADTPDVYVLNYERGAWSKFPSVGAITAISCQSDGNVLFGLGTGGFKKLNQAATVNDSSATYVWQTPYLDFGKGVQKQSKMVRVLARDNAGSSIVNSVAVSTDIDDDTIGAYDTKTLTVSTTKHKVQELAPPGVGRRLSYKFSKTGNGTSQNEVCGFDAYWTEGGVY